MPLERTKATDEEQDYRHTDIGEYNAHPDFIGQGVHEGEDPRTLLGRSLDHDTDAKTHKRFREINDPFSG